MVEGNSLENYRAGNGTVGSNPTLSANRKSPSPSRTFSISVEWVKELYDQPKRTTQAVHQS